MIKTPWTKTHLVWELHKHNCRGTAEVQPHGSCGDGKKGHADAGIRAKAVHCFSPLQARICI